MQGKPLFIFTLFQIAAAGLMAWLLVKWPTPWNGQRYVGTVLVLTGAVFIVIARFQLGKSFSVTAQARALVTTGLYSKIRNPIYVFGTLLLIGLLLIVQKPVLWILVVIIVAMQTIRARKEARVLEAAFGDSYREYRRKTWF